ncbi:MAG: efflux RND transporter periplasmic adaptor subunit [Edaphocola sp.]
MRHSFTSLKINPLWGLLPCALAFFAACGHKKESAGDGKKKGGDKQQLAAEVFVVRAATLNPVYESSGNLLANEAVNVYPEVAGRITAIHFKEGSRVHKGQLLVQLFDSDIKAQIQKLQAQRKLQATTEQRYKQLLDINGISRQEYDAAATNIAATDADIAYNEALLRRLQIRAPFDGTIGLRNISVGAVVATATLITTIQQINTLKLDFPLPEQYKQDVALGQSVRFTVDGNADTNTAKLIALQPAADETTRTITVRALVPNVASSLMPGAFAHVYVPLRKPGQSLMVPSQCIIPTTREKQVALLRDNKVHLTAVQTGIRTEANVEITQGLQAGDTILTTGIMQVKEGMEVKVSKRKN